MKTENEFTAGSEGIIPVVGSILSSVFCGKNTEEAAESSAPDRNSIPEKNEVGSDTVRDILSKLETKRERAAENLGVSREEVESLPFDLSALETEGIFMNIDTRGFGSLARQLDWKTLGGETSRKPFGSP